MERIKIYKIGMELEVSRERSLFLPILKKDTDRPYCISFHNTESSQIVEFGLRPVKFQNEKNTLRRFLYSAIFSFFVPRRRKPFDNKNYRGEWSIRGESDHLHFSFQNFNLDDSILYFADNYFYYLIPLLSRQDDDETEAVLLRDAIIERACISDNLSLYYYDYDYDYDYELYDSKTDYLTINTTIGNTKTLEFRVNENPFPILFILLIEPIMNEVIKFDKGKLDFTLVDSRIYCNKDYLKSLLRVIEQAKSYYAECSSDFSSGGEVYKKVLDIASQIITKNNNIGIGEFNFRLFLEVHKWFKKIDKIYSEREKAFRTLINSTELEYFYISRAYRRNCKKFGYSNEVRRRRFLQDKYSKLETIKNIQVGADRNYYWTWQLLV